MAKYNEILVGRFNNALKKFFSMKGPAPAPQVAGEIGATIPLFFGVENRFLEEWTRFASFNAQAGVAATFASLRLRNPTGSNVIVVVEKIAVAFTVVDIVSTFLGPLTGDLATIIATATRLDARGRPAGSAVLSQGTPAAINTTNIWAADGAPNVTIDEVLDENQEITVLPGDVIQIQSQTANTLLRASIMWRERFLEESERQ
jgi:hypothetical protein